MPGLGGGLHKQDIQLCGFGGGLLESNLPLVRQVGLVSNENDDHITAPF